MLPTESQVEVYLEAGRSRTFAIAPHWPGWCRSGRDDASALQALFDYGPRYALALKGSRLEFRAPSAPTALLVVERLPGNATTDFGAPDLALPTDMQPVNPVELERLQTILKACWETFDHTVQLADGKVLRKGPRGGGRDLAKIIEHVRDVEVTYLSRLGGKVTLDPQGKPSQALLAIRQAILMTLGLAARGEVPDRGPRGGMHWSPRYFVRVLPGMILIMFGKSRTGQNNQESPDANLTHFAYSYVE